MNPRDLLKTCDDLIGAGNNRPREANLRRATSTAYYALFHALARCCADLLIGGTNAQRSKLAWVQTYRALEHGATKSACSNNVIMGTFPQEIQDFANMFVTMQEKRHKADYDPDGRFHKSTVSIDIQQVASVINDFQNAPISDRRAFAAHVLFKRRL